VISRRAFARVIVEPEGGKWTAYFGDEPHNWVREDQPSLAIRSLLGAIGRGQFAESGIVPITDAAEDGRLEFLAPFNSESM
jgi:hypothetical protein